MDYGFYNLGEAVVNKRKEREEDLKILNTWKTDETYGDDYIRATSRAQRHAKESLDKLNRIEDLVLNSRLLLGEDGFYHQVVDALELIKILNE